MEREGRTRDDLGPPVGVSRGDLRVLQELKWHRLRLQLSGLRPTDDQRAKLLDLCRTDQLGRDAVLYQVWSERMRALLGQIQTTPAGALSDAQRDQLIKALWIAREETGIRLTRLLAEIPVISRSDLDTSAKELRDSVRHQQPGFEAAARAALLERPARRVDGPSGGLGSRPSL